MIIKNSEPSQYAITRLEKKHDRSLFFCSNEELDNYLKTQASQDVKKNVAVTYVLTSPSSERILGYYTLSSIGIFSGELPEALARKLPRYPILPGILLGRLAVDKHFQGKKIDALLLIDALKRSVVISSQIGIISVIVEAKDENAKAFYKHYGFIELLENTHRLFLPLSSIKQLDF